MDYAYGSYVLSDNSARLDLHAMHAYLRQAYWCAEIPFEVLHRAVHNSLCIGVYDKDGAQVGLARFISDYATFCYVCDVYVLEGHRGRGLAKELLSLAARHPQLQGLRRWMLVTRDAHGLYHRMGFKVIDHPERFMEILVPDIYNSSGKTWGD